MEKEIYKTLPIAISLTGATLLILGPILFGDLFAYVREFGGIFLSVGLLLYFFRRTNTKIDDLKNSLELNNTLSTKLLTPDSKAIITWLRENYSSSSYIYKVSLFIGSNSLDELEQISRFFIEKPVDSNIKLIINKNVNDFSSIKSIDTLREKYKNNIEVRWIASHSPSKDSLLIIDKQVVSILNYDIGNTKPIILQTTIDSEVGENFIRFFKELWKRTEGLK